MDSIAPVVDKLVAVILSVPEPKVMLPPLANSAKVAVKPPEDAEAFTDASLLAPVTDKVKACAPVTVTVVNASAVLAPASVTFNTLLENAPPETTLMVVAACVANVMVETLSMEAVSPFAERRGGLPLPLTLR
jgi:anaerobic C4-dicarboxylate transporter